MRICGAFCRRFETVVRSTCIDVSYLRKRLSQFVGCTGFFLATM
ncbi:putative glycine betaine/L-proline ABC transporter, ATP-binding subunit [Burkholderia thailandensis]|uniref:Glycine betaine/L-proline ABC transporter, ATP-binding subunit n=1 Tax=Burkholderia thailandensis TaxID=57975 RepID=A0AAW9CS74_BURTH|nr:putative glycine betaine/L-proline ABC transporter, ATP-binding subunit [Burkholderia thailandensis]